MISAHAQNTCVKRSDMAWLPRQRRFVVAGMRYDWVGAKTGPAERVSSVLRFDRVLRVSHLGLSDRPRTTTLNLLAVTFEKTDPPAGMIILAFADGALVRLEVECVEVELCDMGFRRPAAACPGHALSDASSVSMMTPGKIPMAIELEMAVGGFRAALRGAARRQARVCCRCRRRGRRPSSRMCAARGDAALADYSRRFDRVDRQPEGTCDRRAPRSTAATAACEPKALEALELAHARVIDYHERQKPADVRFTDALGVELGWRWRPIEAVGLYVPGGAASYPSSVIMNAVPAKVAGCAGSRWSCRRRTARVNPLVLAAARIAGVDEIYRVGGAQAIAALAYGTADDRAGRQDRRTRQRLCRGGEAARVRRRSAST